MDLPSSPSPSPEPPSPEEQARLFQEECRKKAAAVKFTSAAGKSRGNELLDRVALYKQARQIDFAYQKAKLAHNWCQAFYLLQLYMEISLRYKLHRPSTPRFENEAGRVLENLKVLERRLKIAKTGMLWQIRNSAAVAAAAAASASASTQTQTAANALTPEQISRALDALSLTGASSSSTDTPFNSNVPAPTIESLPMLGTLVGASSTLEAGNDQHSRRGGMTSESTLAPSTIKTLKLKSVTGDGSCAFRAIAQGMAGGELSYEEETRRAADLRRTAVRLLRAKSEEEMVGTGMKIREVVLMKESYPDYETYCDAMSRSDYAGETEFWLLAEHLDMRISIFANGEDGLDHLITYGGNTEVEPVCLYWQRGASEMGNHYDCLLPE